MKVICDHAGECDNKAPDGYFLADNGEAIKKSCETCTYYYHYQEYSNHEFGCEFNDSGNGWQFLPTFPFKNGCKHFDPDSIYLVDWEAELQKMENSAAKCVEAPDDNG